MMRCLLWYSCPLCSNSDSKSAPWHRTCIWMHGCTTKNPAISNILLRFNIVLLATSDSKGAPWHRTCLWIHGCITKNPEVSNILLWFVILLLATQATYASWWIVLSGCDWIITHTHMLTGVRQARVGSMSGRCEEVFKIFAYNQALD